MRRCIIKLFNKQATNTKLDTFFTQSELIEPVLPQAAQLGIHFYCFHNTQLEMHLLEGPD